MLRAAGRQIAKRHKKAQRPHGRQSVKKLMAHGENVNSIEVEAPKLFDRMARRFNVDYIAKLRKKLNLGPDDLKTVMGRGYALSMHESCRANRSL